MAIRVEFLELNKIYSRPQLAELRGKTDQRTVL